LLLSDRAMSLLCGPALLSWIFLLPGVFQCLLLQVQGSYCIPLCAMLSGVDAMGSSQPVVQGSIFPTVYTASSMVIQSILEVYCDFHVYFGTDV